MTSFLPRLFVRISRRGLLAILAAAMAVPGVANADQVSFQRDVRPILSDNCFQCHGPDPASRKANLRLDTPEGAFAISDGKQAVVPGKPHESLIIQRITTSNPDDVMPPADSGKMLKPAQVELLQRWIEEGAEWPQHWAFVPPVRPAVPEVSRPEWVRNPIDAFVLARLDAEGLAPSPEADAITLLRRLSLDITGLPPTLEEIEAYSLHDLDLMYSSTVERLLASPHYGERWARDWLDAAQYADSDGFEKDKPRFVWSWRDWVINAFNANMPYDQFVREQIAGDLLPNATESQIIATGFLRNSMQNEEGGIDPEQFRMEAMYNRVDVVGRAMLGLTVNCAQCHTHKYDPLTHTEYYRLMAYLNNSYEACMTVYSEEDLAKHAEIDAKIAAEVETLKQKAPDWKEQMAAWETEVLAEPQPNWHTLALEFDDTSASGQKCLPQGDGSYLAQGYAPTRHSPKMSAPSPLKTITALRLDLLMDHNLPAGGPGRSIYGTCALSEIDIRVAPADAEFAEYDKWEKFEIASAIADVNVSRQGLGPEYPDKGGKRAAYVGPIPMAIDGDNETAWTTDNGPGRRNQPRYAIFTLANPVEIPEGHKIGIRLAQSHGGWNSDDNQNNNLGRFKLSVTDATELPSVATPLPIRDIVGRALEERSAEDSQALFAHWITRVPAFAFANFHIEKLWTEKPSGTTQLVYHERDMPRVTHRLDRGDFLSPAEPVEPGVPAFLNPMPEGAPANRLGLAAWITDRNAPTTARALVNRVWMHYFGTGLTATPSDLGVQGESPSHPELLDWLAVEFMDSGWDVKHLHRLIVNSSTYRQASQVTPELQERDPANRLLARGSRYRVDGEIVRDITLAASGLLDRKVGGRSVYPPAPDYLFEPPASYGPKVWATDTGGDRYRRGIYTFRFRSVPHPVMQAFDVPPGDSPCVGRARSNTPLQALATLNEGTFVECAQALAGATLREGGETDDERLEFAFRRCAARAPSDTERQTLLAFLDKQRGRLDAGTLNAETLLDGGTDHELAAWTLAARVMLNLDETITRE